MGRVFAVSRLFLILLGQVDHRTTASHHRAEKRHETG